MNVVPFAPREQPQPLEGDALVALLMRLARAGQWDNLELAIRLALSVAATKEKR